MYYPKTQEIGEKVAVYAKHKRIARWTFPLWLYVAVSGWVVYWMLYHL